MTPIEAIFSSNVTTYYLIFTDSPLWHRYFLKDNFAHVYILTHDQWNWILLNPRRLFLHVEIPPYKIKDNVPYLISGKKDKVLKVEMYNRFNEANFGYFGFSSCIRFVRYTLGFRAFALTPYGLYKKLLKLNADQKKMHGIHSVRSYK